MRLSLSSAAKQPIVFLHYPPLSPDGCWQEMIDLLHEYQVKRVFYGHIHGKACRYAVQGERDGIEYRLVSGDHLQFHPIKIL